MYGINGIAGLVRMKADSYGRQVNAAGTAVSIRNQNRNSTKTTTVTAVEVTPS